MAKKANNKKGDLKESINTTVAKALTPMQLKNSKLKPVHKSTIEMLKDVAGMKKGDLKEVPTVLANQMVKLGNAKII